ncbi:hypothetical protein vseg_018489 [Gypsophila vaccaria]
MAISSFQMMKPAVFSALHSSRVLEFDKDVQGKGVFRWRPRRRGFGVGGGRICCKLQDDGEPPESLFMKELRRRGLSSTSLLEETDRGTMEDERRVEGGDRPFSNWSATASGPDKSLTNQREQSMALNSEGLEGLIPRAKLLLTLGGTFFLAFWPLIIATVASTAALYLYFGSTFIHDGRDKPTSPPQYIDPYVLLEEERIAKK